MTKITKNDQKDYNGQNDQKISKFIKAFFWKGGKIVYVKYKV